MIIEVYTISLNIKIHYTRGMKYPDDFKDYDGATLNNGEVNEMIQSLKNNKCFWTSSGDTMVVRVDEEGVDAEILVCRINKSATLSKEDLNKR